MSFAGSAARCDGQNGFDAKISATSSVICSSSMAARSSDQAGDARRFQQIRPERRWDDDRRRAARAIRFDRKGSTRFGAASYSKVTEKINGLDVAFDENALTDLEILCYYAVAALHR